MTQYSAVYIYGGLLCYGAPSKAFRRKRFDASVSTKALLMSAMLKTESWATEVRSCPCPQCTRLYGMWAGSEDLLIVVWLFSDCCKWPDGIVWTDSSTEWTAVYFLPHGPVPQGNYVQGICMHIYRIWTCKVCLHVHELVYASQLGLPANAMLVL